jgi:hypothetical protein
MKKYIYITIIIVILIASCFAYYFKEKNVLTPFIKKENIILENPDKYENGVYGFSLGLTNGYTARTLGAAAIGGSSETVVIENGRGDGVQILISEFADDLTLAKIKKELPKMKMENVKEINIQNTKAVAFTSDSAAFGGASYEVWFSHAGNLYQASTYASSSTVLNDIISSWAFK